MANSTTLYRGNDGRTYVDVTLNKTLAITDVGVVQNVIADSITITLPATVVGYKYLIRNGGVPKTGAAAGTGDNGSLALVVAPNASDLIAGMQVTAADNKAFTNTKATALVGDELDLIGDGVNGWFVEKVIGTWAKTPQ